MSARVRTCLGCEGTGFACPKDAQAIICSAECCEPCAACAGTASVTEPDTWKDGLADVETVALFMRDGLRFVQPSSAR